MCDNKTGKPYHTHGLQLSAYKLLWDSLFPDMPIDEMWGLYLSDSWIKKSYTIKKYKFELVVAQQKNSAAMSVLTLV